MITFTELLKRAKREEITVHTPTEEQAEKLLKELGKRGFKWISGTKFTVELYYGIYKEYTCYTFDLNKEVWYSHLSFYQKLGFTSIEFSDIDFEN